jgi:hypothetical protein
LTEFKIVFGLNLNFEFKSNPLKKNFKAFFYFSSVAQIGFSPTSTRSVFLFFFFSHSRPNHVWLLAHY